MQNIDWQQIATFLFVVMAVAYAIRKFYYLMTRKPGCSSGGCTGCSGKTTTPPDGFVPLDALTINK